MSYFVIYTSENCIWCDKAKALLDANKIPYIEHDIIQSIDSKRTLKSLAPNTKTLPQIFYDSYHIGGYDELLKLSNYELQQIIGGK